ncbi:hypothetical protein LX24_01968 [Desulfallas thermosapovorans DSM 6562]|uniref:Uncharacterized protein n=1 Tax=Desulfallas thermosapovorans DSM 6562 TaxID=1121431 RepID=A0A5S4ZPX9_9FIRM|nr:hypothetical protein LX24_01968 [Desulfallas thermosapovorans DSM 6562]
MSRKQYNRPVLIVVPVFIFLLASKEVRLINQDPLDKQYYTK